MNAVQSIFSLPKTSARVSFTYNGAFHYSGFGYAYIIRPSKDGAIATIRIARALMNKFRAVCFRDVCKSKCPDMEVMETGCGWWKIASMSEVGDSSVHRFFYHLNKWRLAVLAADRVANIVQKAKCRYSIMVEQVGKTMRVLDQQPQPLSAPKPVKPVAAPPSMAKLQRMVNTVNQRYGHAVH